MTTYMSVKALGNRIMERTTGKIQTKFIKF